MEFDYLWSRIGIGLDVVLDGQSKSLKDYRGDYEREGIQVLKKIREMGFNAGKHYVCIHLPPNPDTRKIVLRLRIHSKNTLGLESGDYFGAEQILKYLEANKERILEAA